MAITELEVLVAVPHGVDKEDTVDLNLLAVLVVAEAYSPLIVCLMVILGLWA